MAEKKKLKRFSAVKAVKELARERVGAPRPVQRQSNVKLKKKRYKPTLGKLLSEHE